MPFTLTMPKLSPTMEEGTIVKWHKKEGDKVNFNDLLFEVATDKATVEHNALDEGWIRKILVPEGATASLNQPLAVMTENESESIDGYAPEGELRKDSVLEKEPAKIDFSLEKTTPLQPLSSLLQQPSFIPEQPLENYIFDKRGDFGDRNPTSPLARKIAKEKGLDLSTVKGSGPHGRIMKKDLELAQSSGLVTFGSREKPKINPGSFEEEPLKPIRKIIGQRLQEAKSFIPHFYINQEIDAEPLYKAWEQLKSWHLKISLNDFVIRATALALREHPLINAGFNSVNQSIIHFQTIDIAVAVSIPEGLITPIIRHADYKNLGEISLEVKALGKRAKEGKLAPHEYKGGSFTISNLGMFGTTDFKAIINPPQAAILAVGAILDRPVVKEGSVVPGKVMNLTLSADHRVIDGAAGALFMKTLQKYLEAPSGLIV